MLIHKPCEGDTEHPLGLDLPQDPDVDHAFMQFVCNLFSGGEKGGGGGGDVALNLDYSH